MCLLLRRVTLPLRLLCLSSGEEVIFIFSLPPPKEGEGWENLAGGKKDRATFTPPIRRRYA